MSINRREHNQKSLGPTIEDQMIDSGPRDQNAWDRDQDFVRPRPRPKSGLETLTPLELSSSKLSKGLNWKHYRQIANIRRW